MTSQMRMEPCWPLWPHAPWMEEVRVISLERSIHLELNYDFSDSAGLSVHVQYIVQYLRQSLKKKLSWNPELTNECSLCLSNICMTKEKILRRNVGQTNRRKSPRKIVKTFKNSHFHLILQLCIGNISWPPRKNVTGMLPNFRTLLPAHSFHLL